MTHPRKRHAGARILFGLLATIVSMSAGCTPTEQPPIPFTGLTKDLRIRWSAEPGIDLLTGPAVIVRAYRESYVVGGLMANPAYYYPGFEHAVPQNGPNVSPLIRPLVTGDSQLERRGFQIATPIVGTWREHILSLTGDPTSGYTAKVCVWDTGTGVLAPNGQYRYPNRLPRIRCGQYALASAPWLSGSPLRRHHRSNRIPPKVSTGERTQSLDRHIRRLENPRSRQPRHRILDGSAVRLATG